MLDSTAVDLPLMRSAVLVSQFLQLYLKKRPCKLYQKSLSDTLVLDEPKLSELEYVSVETSLKKCRHFIYCTPLSTPEAQSIFITCFLSVSEKSEKESFFYLSGAIPEPQATMTTGVVGSCNDKEIVSLSLFCHKSASETSNDYASIMFYFLSFVTFNFSIFSKIFLLI